MSCNYKLHFGARVTSSQLDLCVDVASTEGCGSLPSGAGYYPIDETIPGTTTLLDEVFPALEAASTAAGGGGDWQATFPVLNQAVRLLNFDTPGNPATETLLFDRGENTTFPVPLLGFTLANVTLANNANVLGLVCPIEWDPGVEAAQATLETEYHEATRGRGFGDLPIQELVHGDAFDPTLYRRIMWEDVPSARIWRAHADNATAAAYAGITQGDTHLALEEALYRNRFLGRRICWIEDTDAGTYDGPWFWHLDESRISSFGPESIDHRDPGGIVANVEMWFVRYPDDTLP